MNLLAVHVFKRLRYNFCTSISQINRQYCNVSSENELKSAKFSGYKVIYTFPHITYPYILNKMKRNMTIGAVPIYPIALNLGISTDECLSLLGTYCLVVTALHGSCYLLNNLIGTIYFNEDTQKVIISYINYWGKRIDLKRDVNNIIPLSENNLRYLPNIFKFLQIEGYNQKLKLYIKGGNIHGQLAFYKLFSRAG